MASSTVAKPASATTPKKSVKKTSETKSSDGQDSAKKVAKNNTKYGKMIVEAVSKLTKGTSKGCTKAAISNEIKRENEITSSNKVFNNAIRANLEKLMEDGSLKVTGTGFSDYHFKLGDDLKKKKRADEAKENRNANSVESKPAAVKKASSQKKTAAKSPLEKKKKTPVKTAKAKPVAKKATPKKTPQKAAPKSPTAAKKPATKTTKSK